MKLYKLLLLVVLMMVFGATTVYADCNNINKLPFTVLTSGHYCLKKDLATDINSGIAIDIQADNVQIDLKGHTIDGSSAGTDTATIGIGGEDITNIKIRNGTVRGFLDGINLFVGIGGGSVTASRTHKIVGIHADKNIRYGIRADGGGVVIRNNRVTNTGPGSPNANIAYGIEVAGTGHEVIGNTIYNIFASERAVGILTLSTGGCVVRGNRVMDINGGDESFGITPAASSGPAGAIAVYANQVVNGGSSIGTAGIDAVFGSTVCKDNIVMNYATGLNCIDGGGNVSGP